ncbi:MAG: aminopeptidase [Halobacteriales archaeon]
MTLQEAADTAVAQCMALEGGEGCTIVTDEERQPIGEALYDAAVSRGADAAVLRYQSGDQHGAEPPRPVAAAMRETDVFLAPTTKSLSHTRARSAATEAGARGATLPGITEEVMIAGLDADYEAIADHCASVKEQVEDADAVRITSLQGTDLTIEPGGREWQSDTGINHEAGDFSNLPAGEVFISPLSGHGRVVLDGSMAGQGRLEQPIVFEVQGGQIVGIEDPTLREQVEAAAEEVGEAASNLAELGIGTNVGVTELVGSVLLDEKAAGTVHVAIGDDASIGGDVEAPLHLDGVLREPTVHADGEPVELPSP